MKTIIDDAYDEHDAKIITGSRERLANSSPQEGTQIAYHEPRFLILNILCSRIQSSP